MAKRIMLQLLVFVGLLCFCRTSFAEITFDPVKAFDPIKGAPGEYVYVKGSGFGVGPYQVRIGGVQVPPSDVTGSDGLLQVKIPMKAVTGPIAVGGVASPANFTVNSITKIDPASGAPGETIHIYGTNFDPVPANNQVTFKNAAQLQVSNGTSEVLAVVIPQDADTGPIKVYSAAKGETVSTFDFTVSPKITSFWPPKGAAGAPVSIEGKGFDPVAEKNTVLFETKAKAEVSKATANTLEVIVPANAKDGKISVSNSRGTSPQSSNDFDVLNSPKINRLEPASGIAGTTVVIYGTHFATPAKVKFNNRTADLKRRPTSGGILEHQMNPEILVVTVPKGLPQGSIDVTVETQDGTATIQNAFIMTGPENAIHLYGGSTVNFWGNPRSTDTAAEVLPLVGLIGVHKWQMDSFKLFNPYRREGQALVGAEISYRGVTADKALAVEDGGFDTQTLASSKSVAVVAHGFIGPLKCDTFSAGISGFYGWDFLTDNDFKRNAQYSNGIYLKLQDDRDPLYYVQVGYGNTEYLSRDRLLVDLSFPLLNTWGLQKDKAPTSFYDNNFTDFYFFAGLNLASKGGRKDDIFSFGIKGVISAARLANIFNPNAILKEKEKTTSQSTVK